MPTLEEFAQYRAKYNRVVWIDGLPWCSTRRVLEPLAMPHVVRPVDRAKVRQAMKETNALIALERRVGHVAVRLVVDVL